MLNAVQLQNTDHTRSIQFYSSIGLDVNNDYILQWIFLDTAWTFVIQELLDPSLFKFLFYVCIFVDVH